MKVNRDTGCGHLKPTLVDRSVWIVLIIAAGACLSLFFACVTPFAALATLAGLKLERRDAFAVVGLVWLVNQVIGYGIQGYPRTWDSAGWGLAIGASSGLAILAARALSTNGPVTLAVSLPFVAAFAMFELSLSVAGVVLPGSDGAFSASVVGHLFLTNLITLSTLVAADSAILLGRSACGTRAPATLMAAVSFK